MPCEVCVSEAAVKQWREDVAEARAEAREERAESNEMVGKLETVNTLLNDERIRRIELERQNATLDQEIERRARREKIAWGVAATGVVASVVIFLFAR